VWSQFFLSPAFIINFIVLVIAVLSAVVLSRKYKNNNMPFEGIATNFMAVFIIVCVIRLLFLILSQSFPDSILF